MKPHVLLTDLHGSDPRPFLVVVHDVCSLFEQETLEIIGALNPMLGQRVAAAVVPNWRGRAIEDAQFCESLIDHFGEILLHGWTHQRESGGGLISLVTRGSDEFAGLTASDACRRLMIGKDRLQGLLGRRVAGFVPPAWQRGPIDCELLQRMDIDFLIGYREMRWADGYSIPLSTLTWDVGRFAALGLVAEWIGQIQHRYSPKSLPGVAIHPIDVSRGYLPRIVGVVKHWLAEGRVPVLPSTLSRPSCKEAVA